MNTFRSFSVVYFLFASLNAFPNSNTLETGSFTALTPNRDTPNVVNLAKSFDEPIIISAVTTSNGPHRFVTAVQPNGNSFNFTLVEFQYHDGWHTAEDVDYIVVEEGVNTYGNARVWEAGKTSLKVGHTATVKFTNVPRTRFVDPLVFLQVVSSDGHCPVVAEVIHVMPGKFYFTLKQEENPASPCTQSFEVHWIALEAGNSFLYEAQRGTVPAGTLPTAEIQFLSTPNIRFCSAQTMNGNNPFVARVHATDNVQHSVTVQLREETSGDPEEDHISEEVACAIFF